MASILPKNCHIFTKIFIPWRCFIFCVHAWFNLGAHIGLHDNNCICRSHFNEEPYFSGVFPVYPDICKFWRLFVVFFLALVLMCIYFSHTIAGYISFFSLYRLVSSESVIPLLIIIVCKKGFSLDLIFRSVGQELEMSSIDAGKVER